MSILRDVQRFLRGVEKLEYVRWRGGVDDGGRYQLVHSLVIGWFCRIVHDTSAAAIDGTGQKSHPNRLLVGYTLKGTNEISAFKILMEVSVGHFRRLVSDEGLP